LPLPIDVAQHERNAASMPSPNESDSTAPPLSRDELVTLVARAHGISSLEESALAGRALAAQSQLPRLVAENLGAGFGQWDFFPEAGEIVDFALAYTRPSTEEDVWTIARAWAADEAAGRQTLIALAGRDVLQHELRRIAVATLSALIDETRPSRARELRVSLGLAIAPLPAAKPAAGAPRAAKKGAAPKPATAAAETTKMPKPEFKRPAPLAPTPPAKRFEHPKFGAGVLESQSGSGPEAKLTIKFEAGSKTLLAKYVTEL
jgi:hypothetical protein